MYEYDHENKDEPIQLHAEIIGQMWPKIAGDIYRQYKSQGRGVLALFMMDDFPSGLEEILPPGKEPTGRGAVGSYIPRDKLLPLENLVGEQGLLSIDKQLGEYDPDTTIVFAFIEKIKNDEGKSGVYSVGYSVTPPAWLSPKAMSEKEPGMNFPSPFAKNGNYNPIINNLN